MSRGQSTTVGRRAVVTGAIGGLAAIAAQALGRPLGTLAASGDNVRLGYDTNFADRATAVTNTVDPTIGALAGGTFGVYGWTQRQNASGVLGEAPAVGATAVRGKVPATATNAKGVVGETGGHYSQIAIDGNVTAGNGEGIGVRGRTKNGIALQGEAMQPGGYGLQVIGRAVFDRSGKTTISGGQSSKTLNANVTPATLVVATIQGNPSGVWVKSVSLSDANDTFTIRLNKAAPSGGVVVGFFIVN